ncbi:MAG: extracellular solute-binding protein [Pseudomonadota bacterium]
MTTPRITGRITGRITRRRFGQVGLMAGTAALLPGFERHAAAGAGPMHGLSAFGALKYPADFSHFDYVNPAAPRGGTFSTAIGGLSFDSVHPFILKGNPNPFRYVATSALLFETLMVAAADEPDAVYGLVAQTAEVAADGTSVTFTLRPEAKFSDGTPITADDCVFSLEIMKTKGHPAFQIPLAPILGAEAEAPDRVRYDFNPQAALRDLPMQAAALPIFSRAFWDGRDFAESTLEPILGSGPYLIEEAEAERRVVLRRRDDYWGEGLPVTRGIYNFERVRVDVFRDRTAAFEGFKAGVYTFREEFTSKIWATEYGFPARERGDVVQNVIPDGRPSGTQGFWFNLRREKFADPRVRQAIGLAFDFEWSNRTLFYGLYDRTDSLFEGGGTALEATGAPTPAELALLEPLAADLPASVLEAEAYVPPKTDASGRPRRVLRQATRLLEEAGWTLGEDRKRRDAEGNPVSIEFLVQSTLFERIIDPYLKNLQQIGIDATLRRVDPAQYRKRLDEFDFDITTERYAMSLTPGTELRAFFHSDSAAVPGSRNLAGIANPAVDALIERVEQAEDRETLNTAVRALDRALRAMHIWVPQWSKASHHIAYWDIYAQPATKPAYDRGVLTTWWVDADKHARLSDIVGS